MINKLLYNCGTLLVKKGTYNYAIKCMARSKCRLTIVTESWSLTLRYSTIILESILKLKAKLKIPFIYLYNAVFQGIVSGVGAPLRQGVRMGGTLLVKKGTYNYAIKCMARNKHLLTIVTESWSFTYGTVQSSLKGFWNWKENWKDRLFICTMQSFKG